MKMERNDAQSVRVAKSMTIYLQYHWISQKPEKSWSDTNAWYYIWWTVWLLLLKQLVDRREGWHEENKSAGIRAPSHYPKRRLSVRSNKVSKPRDLYLELFDRSEMWQALRQQCCRCACQISKRYSNLKYRSRGFQTRGYDSRGYELLRKDVFSDIETGPRSPYLICRQSNYMWKFYVCIANAPRAYMSGLGQAVCLDLNVPSSTKLLQHHPLELFSLNMYQLCRRLVSLASASFRLRHTIKKLR